METNLAMPKWYAVYTRPRWEKKVAATLANNNIECYCPQNRILRQWSDRKKIVLEPLFTSYVFVRIVEKNFSNVRKVIGVMNFVYWLNKPAVIRNEEIDCIKSFLSNHTNVFLEKTAVAINDVVRITKGPLIEYEGNVVAVKNKTVKIFLPSLGYIMVAEIEKTNVEVIVRNKVNAITTY